jgi:hypothetical protein
MWHAPKNGNIRAVMIIVPGEKHSRTMPQS